LVSPGGLGGHAGNAGCIELDKVRANLTRFGTTG
jgi:hypothetical protein